MKQLLLLVALGGCTAGVKPAQTATGGNNATGVAGVGSPGTGGGGNVITGAAGTTGAGGTGTSDASSDGLVCAGDEVMAQPVPLDLYVLMDSSKSMLETTTAGSTKWKAVSDAMSAFFNDAGSAGLGVAVKYFPSVQAIPDTCANDGVCGAYGPCDYRLACVRNNTFGAVDSTTMLCATPTTTCTGMMETCQRVQDCGAGNSPCAASGTGMCPTPMCSPFPGYCHNRDICTSATYATPDIAVTALPTAAIGPMLTAHMPGGFTPTGPALTGALAFARQRLASTPDHRIAVVLVTDGLPGGFIPGFPPTECMPADIPGIGTILSGPMGRTGTPPVSTFVIGVFSPATAATAKTNLDMLATAGGTAPAVVIDTGQNVTSLLQNALKQVQSKAIACSYKIPPPKMGNIDFKKVNVSFKPSAAGATPTVIGKTTMAACDQRGGWYYDNETSPTEIKACPATCQQLQTDVDGTVQIQLGCMTILID